MRCLNINEITAISGGETEASDIVSDLLLAIAGPLVLFQGAATLGAAVGHISCTTGGYIFASSYWGIGIVGSSLMGGASGVLGAFGGAYAGLMITDYCLG